MALQYSQHPVNTLDFDNVRNSFGRFTINSRAKRLSKPYIQTSSYHKVSSEKTMHLYNHRSTYILHQQTPQDQQRPHLPSRAGPLTSYTQSSVNRRFGDYWRFAYILNSSISFIINS